MNAVHRRWSVSGAAITKKAGEDHQVRFPGQFLFGGNSQDSWHLTPEKNTLQVSSNNGRNSLSYSKTVDRPRKVGGFSTESDPHIKVQKWSKPNNTAPQRIHRRVYTMRSLQVAEWRRSTLIRLDGNPLYKLKHENKGRAQMIILRVI